jgi:hypothetical protein
MPKTTRISARAIAAELGVAPSTAARIVKRHPDCPRDSIESFRKWHAKLESDNAPVRDELNAARLEKIKVDTKLSEERLKILQGGYVEATAAEKLIASLAAELAALLRYKFTNEMPPRLQSAKAPEIKNRLSKALDEVFTDHRENRAKALADATEATRDKLASQTSSRSKSRAAKPPKKAKQ